MAGQVNEENPLPLNVVPMVDIIFCLCVFFLVCFQARTHESHLDSWLPKDKGNGPTPFAGPLRELRVVLGWDPASGALLRRFGRRDLRDATELEHVLREAHEELLAGNQPEQPLILDAAPGVPWAAALEVLDLGRGLGFQEVQLAQGPP
jgi:biopolymer transport protein ExbD